MKTILKRAARLAGYRIERWRPANRFDAMRDTLEGLAGRGYRPRIIVDGGANVGEWARMARQIFPDAAVHLIEAQPVCRPALERLIAGDRTLTLHPVAVTEPGRHRLAMTGGAASGGTGVHALTAREGAAGDVELECDATTLDDLVGSLVDRADRALLKLDLEGHELPALMGAAGLLSVVEVILVEAQIFDINDNGLPVFRDVYELLASRGFDLHDLASLGGRERDMRLRMLDALFVRADSALCADRSWM